MKITEAQDAIETWSRNSKFLKKVKLSSEIIKQMLELCSCPYIAFSCGKDSSVLAHLVLEQKGIPLRFLSSGETRLVHNVDLVIDYFKGKGAKVEEICIDRVFSDEWKNATWTEQRKAGNKDLRFMNSPEYDCVFLGLRKEESRPRQISLNKYRTENYPRYAYKYIGGQNKGIVRCCPLAEWTTIDIAAYLVSNDIPVLDWYNYSGIESRTTARLTGDAVRQNVLVYIKQKDPNAYNKLAARFPEFRLFI